MTLSRKADPRWEGALLLITAKRQNLHRGQFDGKSPQKSDTEMMSSGEHRIIPFRCHGVHSTSTGAREPRGHMISESSSRGQTNNLLPHGERLLLKPTFHHHLRLLLPPPPLAHGDAWLRLQGADLLSPRHSARERNHTWWELRNNAASGMFPRWPVGYDGGPTGWLAASRGGFMGNVTHTCRDTCSNASRVSLHLDTFPLLCAPKPVGPHHRRS